jgi:hypothetical protein
MTSFTGVTRWVGNARPINRAGFGDPAWTLDPCSVSTSASHVLNGNAVVRISMRGHNALNSADP